jgi:hypothetical protein
MCSEQGVKDDPGISDDLELWRRIRKEDCVFDKNIGGRRPKSSPCFDDSTDGSSMSVSIAAEAAVSPVEYLSMYPEEGLVKITVGQIRGLGLGITREPTPADPSHACIHGKKKKSIKGKLAVTCAWVISP